MRTSIVAGSLLIAVAFAAPLAAQQVAADVVFRSGPLAGRVVIGEGYSTYRRPVVVYRRVPVRRVVVVERYAPRVIVVERVRQHRNSRQWRRQGYRPVTLYYGEGRYYDRDFRDRPEVREVVVYERDGRYYRDCDDDRDDRRHHRDRYENDWDD